MSVKLTSNESANLTSSRRQAAILLRQAHRRLDAGLDASDSCGWAISLLPESRAAQGLMIDSLRSTGQHEQSATLASTLLRQRPDDWRLWRRRAQSLLALDRLDEATHAINRALALRPNHRRTLLLAADIATRQGDAAATLAILERADAHHPRDAHIAQRLIHALLQNDRADDAAAILEQLPDAAPELHARVCRAQGRLLDARLLLEDAAYYELDESRREQLTLGLIDVLADARDWAALRALRSNDELSPAVALRLAETCLAPGAFAEGAALIERAGDSANAHPHIVVALTAAAGAGEDAVGMLSTPRSAAHHVEPAQRCQPWLQSLLGLIVSDQMDARGVRRAGADPSLNVLDALLPLAVQTFDAALRDHAESDADRAPQWMEMRTMCAAARAQRELREHDPAETAPDAHLRQAA